MMTSRALRWYLVGGGLPVDLLHLDVVPGHHRLQDLQRGLVRHDRIGGREQEALHLAVGVGRQAELGGVVDDLLEVLERDLGLLCAMIAMTWEARLPSGIVTTDCTRFFGLSSAAQARLACM